MNCPIQTVQFVLSVPMHVYQVLILKVAEAIGMIADGIVRCIEKEETDKWDIPKFPLPTFTF